MTSRASRQQVLAQIWAVAWRHRSPAVAALLLLLLAKLAGVAVPLVLKAIVDRFSRPGSLVEQIAATGVAPPPLILVLPVFLLLGYALLRFCGTLFTELRDLLFAPVIQRTIVHFSQLSFARLLALGPRFHVQRHTGALLRDVERGTGGVGFLLGAMLFTVLPTLVEIGAVLAVMAFGYSGWFAVVIVLTFLVYAGLTAALVRKRELHQRRVNEMDSSAHGRLADSLLNYETVKTFAREEFERTRYAALCEQWVASTISNQRTLSALHIGQSATIAAGVAAVMLLAGQQTVHGEMTVGDLVLVNAYVIQVCLPLNALGFVFREARDALVNVEKLFELLACRPEFEDRPDSRPLVLKGGAVRFEHVDFSYEPGRQVLFDLNLELPAGATVAVVGGSGSGKSTLARLLLRLYEVQAGHIRIDGQDLRELRLDSLREAIGVVPQDSVLFNDSIGFNIAYGRAGAGMAEVIEAAKAAQVHEFILSLPQQYDTLVGERGLKLSGGERQRIAIARAFLKNPPIMIFDEATSALDTRAERAIQSELDRVAQGRSTLVIAHRLSTVVDADEIVVLDKGRIVERGRHEQLLQADGLYAQLWALQRQAQQVAHLEDRMAKRPVHLAALLAEAVDGLRPLFDAHRIRLGTDIDLESGSVVVDPGAVGQALRELSLWAIRSTPRGGRITWTLDRHGPNARLSVTDARAAGAGPAPEAAEDQEEGPPFDPLALRSAIEAQGGSFEVEPPSAGRGMRCVIELPLRAVKALPGEGPDPAVPGPVPPLAGLAVMVVEDNPDALETLQLLLEGEGARVMPFGGGPQALAWLRSHPASLWPRLLVCDLLLGELDGFELIGRLRQIEDARATSAPHRVCALALSGLAQPGDRDRALAAGFQLHLGKPVDAGELVAALGRLAGRAGPPEPSTTSGGAP